jgi:serine/threonine protein kinase
MGTRIAHLGPYDEVMHATLHEVATALYKDPPLVTVRCRVRDPRFMDVRVPHTSLTCAHLSPGDRITPAGVVDDMQNNTPGTVECAESGCLVMSNIYRLAYFQGRLWTVPGVWGSRAVYAEKLERWYSAQIERGRARADEGSPGRPAGGVAPFRRATIFEPARVPARMYHDNGHLVQAGYVAAPTGPLHVRTRLGGGPGSCGRLLHVGGVSGGREICEMTYARLPGGCRSGSYAEVYRVRLVPDAARAGLGCDCPLEYRPTRAGEIRTPGAMTGPGADADADAEPDAEEGDADDAVREGAADMNETQLVMKRIPLKDPAAEVPVALEVFILALLSRNRDVSRGITPLLDVFVEARGAGRAGAMYMVMPACAGTLYEHWLGEFRTAVRRVLNARDTATGRVLWQAWCAEFDAECLAVLFQICTTLEMIQSEYAVVHGDLRPTNIFMAPPAPANRPVVYGGEYDGHEYALVSPIHPIVRVGDFGLVRLGAASTLDVAGDHDRVFATDVLLLAGTFMFELAAAFAAAAAELPAAATDRLTARIPDAYKIETWRDRLVPQTFDVCSTMHTRALARMSANGSVDVPSEVKALSIETHMLSANKSYRAAGHPPYTDKRTDYRPWHIYTNRAITVRPGAAWSVIEDYGFNEVMPLFLTAPAGGGPREFRWAVVDPGAGGPLDSPLPARSADSTSSGSTGSARKRTRRGSDVADSMACE